MTVGATYVYKHRRVKLVELAPAGVTTAKIDDGGDEFWVRPDQLAMTKEQKKGERDAKKMEVLKSNVDWQLLAWLRTTGWKFHGSAHAASIGRLADLFSSVGQSFDESLISVEPTDHEKKWTFSLVVFFKKSPFSVPAAKEVHGHLELYSNDVVLALMANGLTWK